MDAAPRRTGVPSIAPIVPEHGLKKSSDSTQEPALDGLDGHIPRGRAIGLLGHNGAGKTTLTRCLLGLLPVDACYIEMFDEPMGQASSTRLHRTDYVSQTLDRFK